MSTAAHEPRRVGPDRAESISGSKVTPRRNASETHDSTGVQYDGDEVPVLIRLPNLHDLAAAEVNAAPTEQRRTTRIDGANHRAIGASSEQSSRTKSKSKSKRSIEPEQNNTKLVVGGLIGGVLIAVALMLLSSGGDTTTEEQDGWATPASEGEMLANEPEISFPTDSEIGASPEPESLYPGYAIEPPSLETATLAGGEMDQTPLGIPYYSEPLADQTAEQLAPPTPIQPATGWPSEAMSGDSAGPALTPASGYAVERSTQDQLAPPTPTYSPSQDEYRSSMYPSDTESYRMGMLNTDRSSDDRGGSILNGNIEIPDTTSIR